LGLGSYRIKSEVSQKTDVRRPWKEKFPIFNEANDHCQKTCSLELQTCQLSHSGQTLNPKF
jgi:hypothetical protein